MLFSPVLYDEPVFRPPAEAYSAIIQATIGCSWNNCAFCEMYTSKKFRIKNPEDIYSDIGQMSIYGQGIRKIFLADGNAFVLSAKKLMPILDKINKSFKKVQRISSYALPKDILNKSDRELREIRDAGLSLLYIGIESGDNELLELINKGETFESTSEGILIAHEAGIETSIMVINGLGGKLYSEQHAVNSARLINLINPKYLSTLTLSMPFGVDYFKTRFKGKYIQQTVVELAKELRLFIENLNIDRTIFRSDHVSNNLVLKGILNRDKEKLISDINTTIQCIDKNKYPATRNIL